MASLPFGPHNSMRDLHTLTSFHAIVYYLDFLRSRPGKVRLRRANTYRDSSGGKNEFQLPGRLRQAYGLFFLYEPNGHPV